MCCLQTELQCMFKNLRETLYISSGLKVSRLQPLSFYAEAKENFRTSSISLENSSLSPFRHGCCVPVVVAISPGEPRVTFLCCYPRRGSGVMHPNYGLLALWLCDFHGCTFLCLSMFFSRSSPLRAEVGSDHFLLIFLVMGPWVSPLTSPRLGFLKYKVALTSRSHCQGPVAVVGGLQSTTEEQDNNKLYLPFFPSLIHRISILFRVLITFPMEASP